MHFQRARRGLIARWIDPWIPEELRGQSETLRGARLLVGGSLAFVFVGLIALFVRDVVNPIAPVVLWTGLVVLLSLMLVPVLLRVTGKLRMSGGLVGPFALVGTFAYAYLSSGLPMPVLALVPAGPLMATFFAGRRVGLLAAVGAIAGLFALRFLHLSGHVFAPPPPPSALLTMRAVVTSACVVFVTALAWLFEAQRERAHAALERSEKRYHAAVEGSGDAAFDWDLASGEVFYSPAARSWLGCAEDAVLGPPPTLLVEDDVERVASAIAEHFETDAELGIECRLRPEVGDPVWVEIRGQATRDEEGTARRLSGSLRDISERKQLDRTRDEFIATVSHELRTPLTAIIGALGLLEGGVSGELPAKADKLVLLAKRNADRLLDQVNALLEMQRIEMGRLTLDLQPVSLGDLVCECAESARGLEAHYQVAIEVVVADDLHVTGDIRRLHQVIVNLLSNAIKYSPKGGRVEVRLERAGADRARIAVRDRGAGIPKSFQGRVFLKFAMADSSATRRRAGTGLGLAITKALVEAHGGRIDFVSSDKGTTFRVDLPLCATPSGAPADEAASKA